MCQLCFCPLGGDGKLDPLCEEDREAVLNAYWFTGSHSLFPWFSVRKFTYITKVLQILGHSWLFTLRCLLIELQIILLHPMCLPDKNIFTSFSRTCYMLPLRTSQIHIELWLTGSSNDLILIKRTEFLAILHSFNFQTEFSVLKIIISKSLIAKGQSTRIQTRVPIWLSSWP